MIENSPATIYSCSKHIRTGREADRYDSGLKAHNLARLFPAIDESHAHRSSTAPQSENAHSIGVQREHVRYDANGNLTNRAGTTLSWFASNLPKAITKNSQNSSVFQYTPTGARWRHAYKSANVTYTQIYLGSLMEKVTQGSAVDWKHYIFAEGQAVVLYSRKSSGVNTLSYLLRDALGSVDAITDSAGAVTVRESFGAFGQRRGTAWSGAPSAGDLSTINGLTRRGYTGHEILDSTDLIHMNGRVYDPFIARFASADPFVDGALNTQGWNRYSYVKNNPLSAIDPSGFAGRREGQRRWIGGDDSSLDWLEIALQRGVRMSGGAATISDGMMGTRGSGRSAGMDQSIANSIAMNMVASGSFSTGALQTRLNELGIRDATVRVPNENVYSTGTGPNGEAVQQVTNGGWSTIKISAQTESGLNRPYDGHPVTQSIGPLSRPRSVSTQDIVQTLDSMGHVGEPIIDLGIATFANNTSAAALKVSGGLAILGAANASLSIFEGYVINDTSMMVWGVADLGASVLAFSGVGTPAVMMYFAGRFAMEMYEASEGR